MANADQAALEEKLGTPSTMPKQAEKSIPDHIPLIFEESVAGRRGSDSREGGDDLTRAVELLGADLCRDQIAGFPEVSEPQALRHFLRLSQRNFGQAAQFYPLGSCTMKYNPVLNDEMAALSGFAGLHPATPAHLAQGALELIWLLERALAEMTGMDAVSLHPAAGAQGELAGLLIVRAHEKPARRQTPQSNHPRQRARNESGELHTRGFRGGRRQVE
jgi:glycine cleavage system P protein (glycine dehydrogenase) subunit 2